MRITGTVAPGKQCVVTLKKRTFLIMESPISRVVGGNRGRGDDTEEGEGSVLAGGEGAGRGEQVGSVAGGRTGAGVNRGIERRRDRRREGA